MYIGGMRFTWVLARSLWLPCEAQAMGLVKEVLGDQCGDCCSNPVKAGDDGGWTGVEAVKESKRWLRNLLCGWGKKKIQNKEVMDWEKGDSPCFGSSWWRLFVTGGKTSGSWLKALLLTGRGGHS